MTTAADGASHRVQRGGGWHNDPVLSRAANFYTNPPSRRSYGSGFGFRLARVPVGKDAK